MSGEAMSEKQVVKDYVKDPMFEENTLLPIKWGNEWLMLDDVIAFMNMLTDENRQLKKKIKGLEKENEQLRQFINKGRRLSVKEIIDSTNVK